MADAPLTLYVASRASIPERPGMWRVLRDAHGWPIISTWIDEAGPGETNDMGELWLRIGREVASAHGLILYAEAGDFPLKGAHTEVGMALALGKRVGVCLQYVELDAGMRPLGSWAAHPLVRICQTLGEAREWVEAAPKAEPFVPFQALQKSFRLQPPACWCDACDSAANNGMRSRMSLCPTCGDKRCPRAQHHDNECDKVVAHGQPT